MFRIMRQLKKGIDFDNLSDKEKELFNKLKEIGVLFNSKYKGKNIYKLSNNAQLKYRDNEATFEVFPNRSIGIFFDYDEIFDCVSEGKLKPIGYFMAYALNPEKDIVENFDLGNLVKVKAIARGYDVSNEGILVRLPNREQEFFKLETQPCITIGLAVNAKAKNTGLLEFDEEISNKFLEGRKGLIVEGKVYFDIKDVKEKSTLYSLKYVDNKYILNKVEDRKLYNR